MNPRTTSDTVAALLVVVSDETYAIPCVDVATVVPLPQLSAIPGAPAALSGTFVFRGRIVPVIDLGKALGLRGAAGRLSARVVLLRTPRGLLGCHVGRVADVKRIPAPARTLDVRRAHGVGETTIVDGRPVHLVEAATLLPPELVELAYPP